MKRDARFYRLPQYAVARKGFRKFMSETDKLEWQETVDLAIATLEKRTGLKLTGLSQPEIAHRVRQWLKAKAEEKNHDPHS